MPALNIESKPLKKTLPGLLVHLIEFFFRFSFHMKSKLIIGNKEYIVDYNFLISFYPLVSIDMIM